MEIEVLVVPDCPNTETALALLHRAAPERAVKVTVISNDDDALRRRFVGSPTFLINRHDPFANADDRIGLACRVYATPDGLRGIPTLDALQAALNG